MVVLALGADVAAMLLPVFFPHLRTEEHRHKQAKALLLTRMTCNSPCSFCSALYPAEATLLHVLAGFDISVASEIMPMD
jgi:hypothetical protein